MTILQAASSSTSSSTRTGRQRRRVTAVSPFSLSPAVLLLLRSASAQPELKTCGNNGKWKLDVDGCQYPLIECSGDCDTDKDCAGDLVCHQRNPYEAVPGCSGGEQGTGKTDYCVRPSGGAGGDKQLVMASSIISPTPSVSPSPTQLPTISSGPTQLPSISSAPSTSTAPTVSLAPTFRPTPNPTPSPTPNPTPRPTPALAPINVSDPVRLRLYWEKGYRWQETSKETFWCMECDGSCSSGNKIKIKWCSSSDNKQKFQYYYDDKTYRPKSRPDLCFTENGFNSKYNPIRLRTCEPGNKKQQWINDPAFDEKGRKQFEIHPARDKSKCLTQQHHPRSGENVYPQSCSRARQHDTSEWIVY